MEALPVGPLIGLVVTGAMFAGVYWDATRLGISRPWLWSALAGGACVVGLYLYLFVSAAPMTGVLMTSNTGLVLYGFEREFSRREDQPAEPGALPFEK